MSVATCLRTNQTSTASLDGIFNVVASQPQSTVVVKKVVAIAISQITYLRAICPPEAYLDKTLDDLNLKILKESVACKRASLLIKWLRGCFEALDKKYLRQIILGVYEDPIKYENLIESYNFIFNYIDDIQKGDGSNIDTSKTSVKNSALLVIRNLLLFFQNLSALPSGSRLVMKLLYYDEVTPDDYHPSGFIVSTDDGFTYPSDVVNIRIGQMSTPFHKFRLKMNCSKQMISVIDGADKDQLAKENVGNGTVENEKSQLGNELAKTLTVSETNKELSPSQLESNNEGSSQISMSNISNVISSSSNSDSNNVQSNVGLISNDDGLAPVHEVKINDDKNLRYGTKCACGLNEDDGLMVLCVKCKFFHHAVCYKILNKTQSPESFICAFCAKFYNLNGTDSTLTIISDSEIKVVCLWRRIVFACMDVKSLNVSWISSRLGVNDSLAQNICDKLLEMKCITKDRITRSKQNIKNFQVNFKFVKDCILPRYFLKESSNIISFDLHLNKSGCPSPEIKDVLPKEAEVGIPSHPISSDDYKKAAYISTRKRKLSFQGSERSGSSELELGSQSQESQSKKYKASIIVESLQY